ncbi:MAG: 4-(cytidine 5'-diphospho)-2-C-methyl-D-erythritol kinase [Chthoniobacterales bacterium]
MQVLAPAKINLSLRILGKRDEDFHEIETVIAPVSLADELTIEKQSRWIDFSCDDPSIPSGDDNLVVRAAKRFFEVTKAKAGVTIGLKKKIPNSAGLGGGSSDAASTLLALNEVFETKLRREALAKIAESIGSDVPFFIFQSPAICRGRGELVTPIQLREQLRTASQAPIISGLSILLLKPEFGVPTAWAYQCWQNSREIPDVHYVPQKFANQIFQNDLERPVFEKFVFLAEMKMWLLQQPEVGAALMSGSGSAIFAVLRPNADGDSSRPSLAKADLLASRAKAALDPKLWTCGCETLG